MKTRTSFRGIAVTTLKPWPGAEISEAISEAAVIALTESRIVKFEFNGTTVEIDPNDIVERYYTEYLNDREGG